jgi:hypothetical protein
MHPNMMVLICVDIISTLFPGDESRLEDCPIRLNGQLYGHRHRCEWDSKFVFVHCGERNLPAGLDYWGGIRYCYQTIFPYPSEAYSVTLLL